MDLGWKDVGIEIGEGSRCVGQNGRGRVRAQDRGCGRAGVLEYLSNLIEHSISLQESSSIDTVKDIRNKE